MATTTPSPSPTIPPWADELLPEAAAVLATVGEDGTPHVVPIAVQRRGEELVVNTATATKKVANARRRASGTITFVGNPKWWVMCSGSLTVVDLDDGRSELSLWPRIVLSEGQPDAVGAADVGRPGAVVAAPSAGPDVGLTHIALVVADAEASVDFYRRFCAMQVVHRRGDPGGSVVWLSDLTRPFVIVLAETGGHEQPLGPFAHLGFGCSSYADLDTLAAKAADEGRLRKPPTDDGRPVGYWTLLSDPDRNTVELSVGQEVGFTVSSVKSGMSGSPQT